MAEGARPAGGEPATRVGIDLVHVSRIERLLADHVGAVEELFTPAEIAYCDSKRRRFEHLAARFAAKEAVLKALGRGLGRSMKWTEVEIVSSATGRPRVRLSGAVATAAARLGVLEVDVSLSHSEGLAIASAVATRRRAA
jgi:holo-[acyl-carrier protein] synthase